MESYFGLKCPKCDNIEPENFKERFVEEHYNDVIECLNCGYADDIGNFSHKSVNKEGYWVKYWYSRGHSDEQTKTYQFMRYSDGFTDEDKDDEELWEQESEAWAVSKGCWSAQSFKYGFEIVDSPPKEWLQSEAEYYHKMARFYFRHLDEVVI